LAINQAQRVVTAAPKAISANNLVSIYRKSKSSSPANAFITKAENGMTTAAITRISKNPSQFFAKLVHTTLQTVVGDTHFI
jgi:hypothetical protein